MSGSHTVVAGDTLSGIAKKYGLSVDKLAKWNDIDNPALIKIGQKIELSDHGGSDSKPVPPPTPAPTDGLEYKVESGDTFSEIGQKFGVPYKEIMEVNGYEDPTKLIAGSTITIPYKTYKVVSGDTFSAIGKKFQVMYEEVMLINGYEDPTKLIAGSTIKIPFP